MVQCFYMTTYELLKSAAEDKTSDPRVRFFLYLQQFTLGFISSSEFEDLAEDKPSMTREEWQKEFYLVILPMLHSLEEGETNILAPNARKFIQEFEYLKTFALNQDAKHIFVKKDYLDNSVLRIVGEIPSSDSDVMYPVFDCSFFEDRGFVFENESKYMFSRTYQPMSLEDTHVAGNCMLVVLADDFYETKVPTMYAQSIDRNGAQFTTHVVPVTATPELIIKHNLPEEVKTLLCVVAYKSSFDTMDVAKYIDFTEYEDLINS